MYFSQVLNGMVLPFVLIFMLVLINDKKLMGHYTNGPIFNTISWVTSIVMIGLTASSVDPKLLKHDIAALQTRGRSRTP